MKNKKIILIMIIVALLIAAVIVSSRIPINVSDDKTADVKIIQQADTSTDTISVTESVELNSVVEDDNYSWYTVTSSLPNDSKDMYFVFTYTGEDFTPTDLTLYDPSCLVTYTPTFTNRKGDEQSVIFYIEEAPKGEYNLVMNTHNTLPRNYYSYLMEKSAYILNEEKLPTGKGYEDTPAAEEETTAEETSTSED